MKVTVRLLVRKDKPYTKTPHFSTAVARTKPEEEYYCTTGINSGMRFRLGDKIYQLLMRLFARLGRYQRGDEVGCS
jgi:hypothetical protein